MACVDVTGSGQIYDMVKKEMKSMKPEEGLCKPSDSKMNKCTKEAGYGNLAGYTSCAVFYPLAAAEDQDITMLNDTIHYKQMGLCSSFSGPDKTIKMMRKGLSHSPTL
jgi:hypothetical protein